MFNLALLQALNGRNVPNPLSCIQCERPFRGKKAWPAPPGGKPRYLRGDIYLNIDQLRTGSERLSAYGWRFHNWIEAKFFRKSTTNPQKNTGDLLADLLRILSLVPDVIPNKSDHKTITGRYLLHVYEALTPATYLTVNKQTGGGSEPRKWLAPLINGGTGECSNIELADYEKAGILGEINQELGDLSLEFHATTTAIQPSYDLGDDCKQYACLLTRIDSFSLSRGATCFQVDKDRKVTFTPDKATVMSEIREHVGQLISTKKTEDDKPTTDEVAEGGALAGGEADVDGGDKEE
ncbi:hypothetical protein GYB59_24925 [bacterium]|nr:hypothetical protein [bacterium]